MKRKPASDELDALAVECMCWTPWETGREIRGRPPAQQQDREPILAAPLPSKQASTFS